MWFACNIYKTSMLYENIKRFHYYLKKAKIYDKIRQKALKGTKMSDKTNSIIITDLKDFDIRHILDCGQIFRYYAIDEGKYVVHTRDKRCIVHQSANEAIITFGEGEKEYFWKFFDLDNDYSAIKNALKNKPLLSQAIDYGHGIRILNQDKWETLISFIISANNHIPRIKGIIHRLCDALGEDKGDYHAFPTPQAMASVDDEFYAKLGAGYRAKYLACTARKVADGFDLESISALDGIQANKKLCTLMGVGSKVADCILLFAYHKQDVFPVDTWIKKVYTDITGKVSDDAKTIRKELLDIYGDDMAGYAQQYLFFNKRG